MLQAIRETLHQPPAHHAEAGGEVSPRARHVADDRLPQFRGDAGKLVARDLLQFRGRLDRRRVESILQLVPQFINRVCTESDDAPRQQGARVKTYRESTASLRNEAGADAAALECQDICETLH